MQDTTYYTLLGMLASVGLTRHDVNAQGAGPAGVWKLFLAGKADAMAGVPDWIGIAQAAGKKIKIFPATNYFQSMSQAILASDKIIRERPKLIGKLVRATLRGMSDIMKDPEAAAKVYVGHVAKQKNKLAYITNVFGLYNKYVYGGQKKIGVMDGARLAALQKFYVKHGIVRKELPVGELYTNQFVK